MDRIILQKYSIKDFSAYEITQGQDIIPQHYLCNIIPTLCVLQNIRNSIGVPVFINSTYRTPENNKAAGGKPGSLHLIFNAIDFSPAGFSYLMLSRLFRQILRGDFTTEILFKEKNIFITPQLMGAGLYNTFIHIDTRGLLGRPSPAVWKG